MELFAKTRKKWLMRFTGMRTVPSHDTFNRIFQAIDPAHFGQFLIEMTERLRKKIGGEIVAFDGKAHRGTASGINPALHMLNAWAVKNRLVIWQVPVSDKSNEITAMPQLMDVLYLEECIITADAFNCQKKIAAKAIEKGREFVLGIKGNQHLAYEEIKFYMDNFVLKHPSLIITDYEKGHGRLEQRK